MGKNYYGIGDNVVPENYSLIFHTDVKKAEFVCDEVIDVVVRKKSTSVVMNSREIKIYSAYAEDKTGKHAARINFKPKTETVVFSFDKRLYGKIKLHIRFKGVNNDKMYGFYKSTYVYNNKKHTLLTTQFEPGDARSAFVSFDEPSFKATFEVSIEVDDAYEALSNMPVKSVKRLGKSRKLVSFMKTPRMSTYLLYLGVGKYDRLTTRLGKLRINALTVQGKKNLAKLPLKYAKLFVDYYQKYFGITFPLPKIDIIAIPDFSAGAMENWGAITFREVAMLGDEKKSSVWSKERIAEVVAHELAHQWFGDLVTMKWWDDIWLNESFAEFMSYKAREAVFPEWNVMKKYYIEDFEVALEADGIKNTHPISMPVKTPGQISGMFDEISYEKGGAVLYMLENYAGSKSFREGLHNYLKKYMYSNAKRDDLWREIDAAAKRNGQKIDVSGFAGAWITKKGHPLVRVSKDGKYLKLSQNRFTYLKEIGGKENVWPLPLDYVDLSNMKVGRINLNKEHVKLEAKNNSMLKFNYGVKYFCRVRYGESLLQRLGKYIENRTLDGVDALEIEREVYVAARSGYLDIKRYYDFVKSYCMHLSYPANVSVLSNIGTMFEFSKLVGMRKEFGDLLEEFALNMLEKLDWIEKKNDSNIDKSSRIAALEQLGVLENDRAVRLAEEIYSKLVSGKEVDRDMAKFALATISHRGGTKEYTQMKRMYEKCEVPELKMRFLLYLGNFEKPDILNDALEYSISEKVKKQDTMYITSIMSTKIDQYGIAWKWVKKNWNKLERSYPTGTHMIHRFLVPGELMHTKEERKDFVNFTSKVKRGRDDIKKSANEILDVIDLNIRFFERNGMR